MQIHACYYQSFFYVFVVHFHFYPSHPSTGLTVVRSLTAQDICACVSNKIDGGGWFIKDACSRGSEGMNGFLIASSCRLMLDSSYIFRGTLSRLKISLELI